MKSSIVLLLSVAASVNALSECILSCQAEEATKAGCTSNYNVSSCYCHNEDWPVNVKGCLYENNCDTDVPVFYDYREKQCNGSETDGTNIDTDDTIEDNGGVLGSCILSCQAEVATTVGCSSNYNETSCYCDNDNFATEVKACLYENCSSQVPIFYNYRSDICGGGNSTEYFSSMTEAEPTAGITKTAAGTGAATAATTTAAAGVTTTAASTSATSSPSSAAERGSVIITGLFGAVAFAMMLSL